MFCTKCGAQAKDDATFCTTCGANLRENHNMMTNNVNVNDTIQEQTVVGVPYENSNPQFNQPNPQFNQPNPQFNQPNPQFNQPNPQFNQPNPQFNQPNPQFNQPNPQFNQQNFASQAYAQNISGDYNINANASGSPKNVSFVEAIKLYFINYVNFNGRSTRSEYWWSVLFNFLVSLVLGWIPVVGMIIALGLIVPSLSVTIRRLHDTGKSWPYIFMGLIPLAGFIILIIQYCKESDCDNQWGPAARN